MNGSFDSSLGIPRGGAGMPEIPIASMTAQVGFHDRLGHLVCRRLHGFREKTDGLAAN
jgi:hypothetical protein